MLKPWLLYAVLAWQLAPPPFPEEQKTIIIQFDDAKECRSVAAQVDAQVKEAKAVFYLKTIECRRCVDVVSDKRRCETPKAPAPAKKK